MPIVPPALRRAAAQRPVLAALGIALVLTAVAASFGQLSTPETSPESSPRTPHATPAEAAARQRAEVLQAYAASVNAYADAVEQANPDLPALKATMKGAALLRAQAFIRDLRRRHLHGVAGPHSRSTAAAKVTSVNRLDAELTDCQVDDGYLRELPMSQRPVPSTARMHVRLHRSVLGWRVESSVAANIKQGVRSCS